MQREHQIQEGEREQSTRIHLEKLRELGQVGTTKGRNVNIAGTTNKRVWCLQGAGMHEYRRQQHQGMATKKATKKQLKSTFDHPSIFRPFT